ncbi:hypothetical protein [uncultured Sphaerochaeta sp.]|uniref:hypothetical protein n=1 Tax=uncultured Sphaerochaeta sp. TaxID=886478 RepID=UPI002A0A41C1|nr:hypothetical protein [uncultured Sphaerochaeta sp.]
MKKWSSVVLIVSILCVLFISLLSSCYSPLSSKTLVVVNESGYEIDLVSITQYVSGSKVTSDRNALADGETIAVGASESFYLAPYSTYEVNLSINNTGDQADRSYFTYEYMVNGKNEAITASFSGTAIVLSGRNVAEAKDR